MSAIVYVYNSICQINDFYAPQMNVLLPIDASQFTKFVADLWHSLSILFQLITYCGCS
jgi:hypothetical protein